MPRSKSNARTSSSSTPAMASADTVSYQFSLPFVELDRVTADNLGKLLRLALIGGGYFGISIPDDGGNCRLAIRCTRLVVDVRCHNFADFGTVLADLHKRLTDVPVQKSSGSDVAEE